jgi:hypothetical protein
MQNSYSIGYSMNIKTIPATIATAPRTVLTVAFHGKKGIQQKP